MIHSGERTFCVVFEGLEGHHLVKAVCAKSAVLAARAALPNVNGFRQHPGAAAEYPHASMSRETSEPFAVRVLERWRGRDGVHKLNA